MHVVNKVVIALNDHLHELLFALLKGKSHVLNILDHNLNQQRR
jgi:hypothetical protein